MTADEGAEAGPRPPLTKPEIVARLRQVAELLKVRGESPYRARAYEIGAAALEEEPEELAILVSTERLQSLRGIGASLAKTITALHLHGRAESIDAILGDLPPSLLELAGIPGLTARRIERLHHELGIESLADFRAALHSGAVEGLRGFGRQTVDRLRAALEGPAPAHTEILLADAELLARRFLSHLRRCSGVLASETAGAVRRAVDTIDALHLVAAASAPEEVVAFFQQAPGIIRAEGCREDTWRFRTGTGLPILLTVVPSARFGAAMLCATGDEHHWNWIADRARQNGIDLRTFEAANEEAIYRCLGVSFIPPELREDPVEWEAATKGEDFSDLVTVDDIRGFVHCHTTHSDGKHSVWEMARAAQARGMAYITITDHSPRAFYAHGVEVERLPTQWSEIQSAQAALGEEGSSFTVLRGTESDILEDGSLDYDLQVLTSLQVVIASIHERHKMDAATMTARVMRALEQPIFKIWGHPLGRLLLKRDPIDCDVEQILDVAARSPVAIEINGSPYRLDLPVTWIRAARRRGLKFVISVDAHATSELDHIAFGVAQARRGGVRRSDVLNTLPVEEFLAAVRPTAPVLPRQ